MLLRRFMRGFALRMGALSFALALLGCGLTLRASAESDESQNVAAPAPPSSSSPSEAGQSSNPQDAGSITGTIVDQAGAVAVGAQVQLAGASQATKQQTASGDNGQFSFSNVPAGSFQLTVTSPGFQTKTVVGIIRAGEAYIAPPIVLAVAPNTTNVSVGLTTEELAQVQIKEQEKQRVLGFIPNFYASYVPDAAPLAPEQKFELAWRSVTDPITFVGVGTLAGIYQASDELNGYGQGAQGYAKRFGAVYADVFIGTFIDSAILPSVLHEDPRYFYRGTGTKKSRLLYAISNAVMCKGDNKQWQPNYSAIAGSFITAGISQAYYPASDRGAGLLVETALIRIAEGSVAGIFQEFVVKKLTPHVKNLPPAQP